MHISLRFCIVFVIFDEIWMVNSAHSVNKKDLNYGGDGENVDDINNGNPYYVESSNIEITGVPDWPGNGIKFGPVSGVSLDVAGNVYVLHRVNRVWNANTFLMNNTFTDIDLGPISEPTVAVIHSKSSSLLYQWGKNMFYLPHSITVDFENNVWITDVAMHQVFKFPPLMTHSNNTTPLLTLGTTFLPGNSLSLFCKPTAVAVLPSGEFFVSDGYCNSRVIKFAPDGTVLLAWGRSTLTDGSVPVPEYHFNVPHDLTIVEDKDLICVSDRENGRIQCFHVSNGSFVYQIQSREIGSRVFSASYTPANGGLFFIVNGRDYFDVTEDSVHGSIIDSHSDTFSIIKRFQPDNTYFNFPHDVIVSRNGTEMYVAELDPRRVWKFKIGGVHLNPSQILNSKKLTVPQSDNSDKSKMSGTMLMAMFITAVVLCFGAVLLTAALIYSRARTRGCSGQCRNPKWLVGRSTVEGFKVGNFLGQHQHQGFVKLNNFDDSDDDDDSPTYA